MKTTSKLNFEINLDKVILAVILFCFVAEAVILLLDIAMNLAELWYFEKFKKLSNIAMEKSFGTWFSVVQNFFISLVALFLALYHNFASNRKGLFLAWLVIALFFAFISLDDHLVLHERFSGTLGPLIFNRLFGSQFKVPSYQWLFLLGPFFGAFGFFMLIFLHRQLESRKEYLAFISGLLLWSIAVLLDFWDGTIGAYEGIIRETGWTRIHTRHLFMLMEEMLEMIGSTLFLFVFLTNLKRTGANSLVIKIVRKRITP